jgi:excinuclease ABC subunit B
MKMALDETNRRRAKQDSYNKLHGIEPVGIIKAVRDLTDRLSTPKAIAEARGEYQAGSERPNLPKNEMMRVIADLEKQMKEAAKELQFERAAAIRDQIYEMRSILAEESNLPPWKKARLLAGEED